MLLNSPETITSPNRAGRWELFGRRVFHQANSVDPLNAGQSGSVQPTFAERQ
jgi:hypothetical protein